MANALRSFFGREGEELIRRLFNIHYKKYAISIYMYIKVTVIGYLEDLLMFGLFLIIIQLTGNT